MRAGQGEVVTDRSERRVDLLAAHPQLVVTWSRYEPGEDGPAPHIHTAHTDCFFVLDGEMQFGIGADLTPMTLVPGELLAVPAGVVHTFANRSPDPIRFLNFHAPGAGFAESLRGRLELFDTHDPPEDGGAPAALALRYAPGDGHPVGAGGSELLIKLGADAAGGHLAVLAAMLAPGFQGPPAHRHAVMIDAFFILDGVVTFFVDGEPIEATAGDFAFIEPGAVHTFANRSGQTARLLNLFAPAGLERYLKEMGDLLDAGTEMTPALMGRLASRHDFLPA